MVLERDGYGVTEGRLSYRAVLEAGVGVTVMVLESNGYGVRE
jgi:hypothetical protein